MENADFSNANMKNISMAFTATFNGLKFNDADLSGAGLRNAWSCNEVVPIPVALFWQGWYNAVWAMHF